MDDILGLRPRLSDALDSFGSEPRHLLIRVPS
jgi:hypothetical protein